MTFDAIVLAGGSSRRMGGEDKLAIDVGGTALLDRVIDAARSAGARAVVVVGPTRPTKDPDVRWAHEDEPGGGPVPAIATGATALDDDDAPVVVLAGDLPLVSPATIARLVDELEQHDVAIVVDIDGRDQYLFSAYKRAALPVTGAAGAAVRVLLDDRRVARVHAVTAGETLDCDTPDDVERARRAVNRSS